MNSFLVQRTILLPLLLSVLGVASSGGFEQPSRARQPPPDAGRLADHHIAKYTEKYEKYGFRTIFDFCFLSYFYQHWVNGLDLNRFCAPEHICELWNSSILRFWLFLEICIRYQWYCPCYWSLLGPLLLHIDCLLIALDAHMFSHDRYGPGTQEGINSKAI